MRKRTSERFGPRIRFVTRWYIEEKYEVKNGEI